MKNLKYESDQPLARLKPGDQATIIRVTHFPFAREKIRKSTGMCLMETMKHDAWRPIRLSVPSIRN